MLEFKRADIDVEQFREYFDKSKIQFCDMSVGAKYMWRNDFVIDYAYFKDTLILRESCPDYKNAFYFPLTKEGIDDKSEDGQDYITKAESDALSEIEKYCKKEGEPLLFCCIDERTKNLLKNRYKDIEFSFNRDWSDYIYNASDFITYAGKKFSGQRNHVHKFTNTYPNFEFKQLLGRDIPRIVEFFSEYERETTVSMWSEREEEKYVIDYAEKSFALGQLGGYIEVDGKMVALSIGEVVGDTLIVHVEKGLKEYAGVYPTMAQLFARNYAVDGVKYINREEDCGDMGLRTSKTQYHPIEIKSKYMARVKTAFDKILPPVSIKTERLTTSDISESDKDTYAKLYLDNELNKYYGYDYREDLGENTPNSDYFYSFMQGLKAKHEEYSLAVREGKELIGEIVLYEFDFFGGAEIGFRFFENFQHKGYALESVSAVLDYAKNMLGVSVMHARAYKKNAPSIKLLERLGFSLVSGSDKPDGKNAEMNFYKKEL